MRFRVDRDVLAEAVAWTARTLPARPPVPVLAGMLLDVGEALKLSSFDYEVSGRAWIDVDVEEPGRMLVPGRLLAEITRNLPPAPVEVAADAAKVSVTCDGDRFTLLALPVEDYPALPEMPPLAGTIASRVFATAVRQVAVAAARDDTVAMLTGVRMEVEGENVTLAATDRYRMAVRELCWKPERAGMSAAALVPARTLAEIAKSLATDGDVSIALAATGDGATTGMIGFECGGRRTTTRLLDEQFINYRSRFPSEYSTRVELRTAPFVQAVKRVALVTERNTPIRLSFRPGDVVLEAGTSDGAQASSVLEAHLDGDAIRTAFNPQYLLDGLAAVDSDTTRMEFTTPTKAAVISSEPAEGAATSDYRHLLMPVRLSD